jgi:hypothetical protein
MPVVQFAPVGLPSPRSADEAPNPLAVVASENLTVASSTRAREARNPAGAQVFVTGSIFRKITERIQRISTCGHIHYICRQNRLPDTRRRGNAK